MLHPAASKSKDRSSAARTAPEPPQRLHSLRAPVVDPGSAGVNAQLRQQIAGLQSTIGNQAVLRMLSPAPPAIQKKLTINQPGDQFEQEADRVADQVMRIPDPDFAQRSSSTSGDTSKLQRKCACGGSGSESGSECESCKEKHEEEPLQRKTGDTSAVNEVPPIVHQVLYSPGQPLDTAARAFFEPRFGANLGDVHVHTDARAAESATQLRAAAYTCGHDVAFAAGKYAPGSVIGDRLLAHELAHVVQQNLVNDLPSNQKGTRADPEEKQAEHIANALGWGGLASRYGGIASHVSWHSGKPILPTASDLSPARARIQRVELTYDDGPDTAGNTRTVLNELNAAGARATFYLVGKRVGQGDNWRVVFDIAAGGHLLGNHAFDWDDAKDNHIFLHGTREERIQKILETELAIRAALIRGRNNALQHNSWQSIPQANRDYIDDLIAHGTGRFRTPGFRSKVWDNDGVATAAAITSVSQILAASGLRPLERTMAGRLGSEGVDVDPKDWQAGRTQAEVEANVKSGLSSNTDSILLHSRIAATAAATPAILADIKTRKFTFDPTPQGTLGSVQPKPGFAGLATISDPPTSAEIAQARAFFRNGIPSYGGFLSGSVALGIFQVAQRAGPAEVDSFANEIKATTVPTLDGPVPLANWMNAYPEWGAFSIFFETWRATKTTPPPAPVPPTPGAVEIFFHFDQPRPGHPASGLSVLTDEGRRNLAALAPTLKADPNLKVQLVGSCSSEGDEQYNYKLGQTRAEWVDNWASAQTASLILPLTTFRVGVTTCNRGLSAAARPAPAKPPTRKSGVCWSGSCARPRKRARCPRSRDGSSKSFWFVAPPTVLNPLPL